MVGALDRGVTPGLGVAPRADGAAEVVDVRGVGLGMDDRPLLDCAVGRAGVSGELTVSVPMVLLVAAGTAVPCSAELHATVLESSAATSAATSAALNAPGLRLIR